MWKNRLAYGLVLLTAAVLLFLYSKSFLLTVLIVLLLLMVINGMLVLHDAHSIRVSMRVRPGGQQGKDVNLNITVNSDKKLLAAGQYTASLKPLEGRIGTTVISAVSGGKLQHGKQQRVAVFNGAGGYDDVKSVEKTAAYREHIADIYAEVAVKAHKTHAHKTYKSRDNIEFIRLFARDSPVQERNEDAISSR